MEDDDHWADKVALLTADPVPLVSFTFGIPETQVIAALRRAGSMVALTVTSAEEAQAATEAGADLLVVQASAAGAHSGTLTPQRIPPSIPLTTLVAQVRAGTTVPLLAAGGLGEPGDVAAACRAGAAAVVVGTVLLRADESGASGPTRRHWPARPAKRSSPEPSPAGPPAASGMCSPTGTTPWPRPGTRPSIT